MVMRKLPPLDRSGEDSVPRDRFHAPVVRDAAALAPPGRARDHAPMTHETPERRCSWCEATASPGATDCPSCGAALAQREDLGGILVPGVTDVDPGLADLADRPMRISGSSPTQGVAPALFVGAALGGPLGVAVVGGVAGVAGAEYLGARRPGLTAPDGLDGVGRPSEIARLAADRLDRGEPVHGDGPGSGSDAGDPGAAPRDRGPSPGDRGPSPGG
jgi:hypothetical protein